ncbi:MAG: phosphate ABC transporter permease PstA [Nitrospira sp.]|jgi:phosphate transport system permease protein|nr:phosphate ABC transporter permease PstA [Nitrospira sp.]MDH4245181.1 phosphate ABC transporter permease PstA [Nitrospira sp.]MDH4354447.1 phosphate ABC transporter permease PstA [Nitrospira sp.]MDH5317136.1 phosphate ABC transporter permease PstA [Nitrospira sp.]
MKEWLRQFMASGELFIWGCGAGLSLSLFMIAGLMVLILINGMGYFWPADLVELTLKDGKHVIGQLAGEDVSPKGIPRIRMKIGNRDLYGLDYRWINADQIVERATPADLVMVERREWGNFYGRLKAILKEDQVVTEGAEDVWKALSPLLSDTEATEGLNPYSVLLVEANGKEKVLAFDQVLRVLRPNDLSTLEKVWVYMGNIWTVLTTEPREANTEGGIFPAIFGTVMMVMIMSFIVTPSGVIGALYLREYARQGVIVRTVRIAVNNLAGVPSIVFGVFGLGFFVYGVGGTIDALWFSEKLPTPTFGTGGILWASLTLALLTVPVVIVATEEGLAAVPREYREGSIGLGATKWETIWKVVLPTALPGILTGLILAMARAAGEVAPLMLTGVVKLAPAMPIDGTWPFIHLDRKFMHLGFHIYDVGFQSPNVEAAKPMVFVTTLVLIAVVVTLNLTGIVLRNRMRRKYAGSTV